MKLYKNFNISKNHKNQLFLIGNFDGVHLGHQKLFKLANKYKKKFKLNIGVLLLNQCQKCILIKRLKILEFQH